MATSQPRLYHFISKVQADLAQLAEPPLASLYHEQSKRWPDGQPAQLVRYDPDLLPEFSRSAFKEYPRAGRVSLPEARPLSTPLDRAILDRRTARTFAGRAVDLAHLGTLLGLSYQIHDAAVLNIRSKQVPKRPVPSGGALYPLELYLAIFNGSDLAAGLYHYHPAQHVLETLSSAPPEPALSQAFLPGSLPAGAAAVLCICGVLPRNRFKYGELGYRLMLLEAGHLAQNVLLVAQALGLAAMPCCGFYDDRMHDYLRVDGVDEVCLYLLVIGHPARPTVDDQPAGHHL